MTPATAFPSLETQRLKLREIVIEDAPAIFDIHGDADLMKWFGSDPLPDIEAAEALIKGFASWRTLQNPGVRWAIEIKDRPGLVGTCGLFGWNRNWRKCAIGYELCREAQGRGYMHEALQTVISWGFVSMSLNRIEATLAPENAASMRSLERLGFVREGHFLQHGYWAGKYHDSFQYSLLKERWRNAASNA